MKTASSQKQQRKDCMQYNTNVLCTCIAEVLVESFHEKERFLQNSPIILKVIFLKCLE